jgi:two-component system sensor histidine kinase KdpD
MGGSLNAEDTPGGGLTMVLSLRAAGSRPGSAHAPADSAEPERQAL